MKITRRGFMTKTCVLLGGLGVFREAGAQTDIGGRTARPRKPPLNTRSFCDWFNKNYQDPVFETWIEEARKDPLAFLSKHFSLTSQQRASAGAGYSSAKRKIDEFIDMVAEGRTRWRARAAGGGEAAGPAPKMARNPSEGSRGAADCPGGYRQVEWTFTMFGRTCTGTYKECIK